MKKTTLLKSGLESGQISAIRDARLKDGPLGYCSLEVSALGTLS